MQVRGLPGQLVVRGHGGALRGARAALAGARHAGRVRAQVGRGAAAGANLRRLADQGPPLLQVHPAGGQIRRGRHQVSQGWITFGDVNAGNFKVPGEGLY